MTLVQALPVRRNSSTLSLFRVELSREAIGVCLESMSHEKKPQKGEKWLSDLRTLFVNIVYIFLELDARPWLSRTRINTVLD
jgi:hypothetical protein